MIKHDIIRKDRIGIMPIGALNVAFASYIYGIDTFIESRKTHYSVGKKLKIYLRGKIKEINLTEENYTNDISSLVFGLPEIILFSPPNHRLVSTLDEVINLIRKILDLIFNQIYSIQSDDYDRINLINIKDISENSPKIIMLSNGIYYEDVISYLNKVFDYVEENIKEEIKGNFIRATSHQTGVRDNDDIFKPGNKGSITIAGGSKRSRDRVISLFNKFDYPIFDKGIEVRRMEFDKAIINLSGNGVQFSMLYDNEGKIHNYTLGDLVSDKKMRDMCKKIIYTMVSIGVKVGIYKNDKQQQKQLIEEISQDIWKYIEEKSKKDNNHIFSSIAIVIERYKKRGTSKDKPLKLPPLEENIINYLINLSNENDLDEEKAIIEELRDSILQVCGKVEC